MNFYFKLFLVFLCVTATDATWAIYIIEVSQKNALSASLWGGLISLLTAVGVIAYTKDRRFLIATVAGAIVGTYIAVKYIAVNN